MWIHNLAICLNSLEMGTNLILTFRISFALIGEMEIIIAYYMTDFFSDILKQLTGWKEANLRPY